jgi:hypothetical protein
MGDDDYSLQDVLTFLEVWHTREDVKERFGLSHTQAYNLFNRLTKGSKPMVEMLSVRMEGKPNRTWIYRTRPSK